MNVILLEENDFSNSDRVRLSGRRAQHIRTVLKSRIGDTLTLGCLHGHLGSGVVSEVSSKSVELAEVRLDKKPPVPSPIQLVLALPRPIVMNRLLAAITTLGIKKIHLIHSRRVEKSYWSSPVLQKSNMDTQLRLGLEQAVDTILPEVVFHKRFKPFVEDVLPKISKNTSLWLAHPVEAASKADVSKKPKTLMIGPEGGFIPHEVELMQNLDLSMLSLGQRILRVETAVHVAVAKMGGLD